MTTKNLRLAHVALDDIADTCNDDLVLRRMVGEAKTIFDPRLLKSQCRHVVCRVLETRRAEQVRAAVDAIKGFIATP